MKQSIIILFAIIFLANLKFSKANDFPSLLVANASMAVIVDHEYLDTEYEITLSKIKYIVDQIIRDDLRDSVGISVRYYSWTQIRFNKGRSEHRSMAIIYDFIAILFTDFTIVMSVSNCKNTWQIFHEVQQETLLLIALTETNCPRIPSAEAVMVISKFDVNDRIFSFFFFYIIFLPVRFQF